MFNFHFLLNSYSNGYWPSNNLNVSRAHKSTKLSRNLRLNNERGSARTLEVYEVNLQNDSRLWKMDNQGRLCRGFSCTGHQMRTYFVHLWLQYGGRVKTCLTSFLSTGILNPPGLLLVSGFHQDDVWYHLSFITRELCWLDWHIVNNFLREREKSKRRAYYDLLSLIEWLPIIYL